MKQRLLALAAAIGALGAGAVLFYNWESATIEATLENTGSWEWVRRETCSMAACTQQQCIAANNILADAGSPALIRLATCDFRVSQRVRNCATDAGVTLSSKQYQTLSLVAMRAPAIDGGNAFGVPMDDAGCPILGFLTATPGCVRAPVAGGTGCQRSELDGGFRYIGAGNVFPVSLSNGDVSCQPVACSVFFGDNPDTSL